MLMLLFPLWIGQPALTHQCRVEVLDPRFLATVERRVPNQPSNWWQSLLVWL